MAHKFYCTNCARDLTQELVLLDMEPALTGSEVKLFNSLMFRVKKADFDEMLDANKENKGDMGFTHIGLPFAKYVEYLSDENNLDDPMIKDLTMEDICKFIEEWEQAEFGTGEENTTAANPLFAPGMNAMEALDQSEEEEKKPKWAPAIEAILRKDTTSKDPRKVQRNLYEDLKLLKKYFGDTGAVKLSIKPDPEKADDGTEVLTKYYAQYGTKSIEVKEARRCCYCGSKIFKYAGLAEHRSVAFIGEQSSGKTSTILSMVSFVESAVNGAMKTDNIWNPTQKYEGKQEIPEISYVEVEDSSVELRNDKKLYSQGYAPAKTESKSRHNAYSATMWIQTRQGKNYLLTLMDLPGELCRENGEIDADNILNNFPVALACDAFIVCFDSMKAGDNKKNLMVCSWANAFQKLRRTYKVHSTVDNADGPNKIDADCAAPMMLLFTKCEGLEEARKNEERETAEEKNYYEADQVKEVYGLKVERDFIDKDDIYHRFGELIRDYNELRKAYFARLRFSPYGFEANRYVGVKKDQSNEGSESENGSNTEYLERQARYADVEIEDDDGIVKEIEIDPDDPGNKNPDGSIRYPRPIHARELMRWLFTVSGYIPAKADYCPNPHDDPDHKYEPDDAYVTRAQYRVKQPWGRSDKEALDEALCRAYLFENYSDEDSAVLQHYEEILKGRSVESVLKGGDPNPVTDVIERFKKIMNGFLRRG